MKKIIITENQFKTVISKFINEATKTIDEPITYNINRSFTSGQYKISNTTDIDNAITDFKTYIESGNVNYEIIVSSSESKVPNQGVGLNPGELSKKRADEVKNYLISKGFKEDIIKIDNKGAQGPEWNRKLGSESKVYTKHQYVKLTLKGLMDSRTESESCIVNMSITVDYKGDSSIKYPEHVCDEALFKMYANGIPVTVEGRKDNIINLNNQTTKPEGGLRIVNLRITPEDAKKIKQKDPNKIVFQYQCMFNDFRGCHKNPVHISMKDSSGNYVLEPTFITTGEERLKFGQSIVLLTTDGCGKNPIKSDFSVTEPSDEFFKEQGIVKEKDKFKLVDSNKKNEWYTSESLAQIYQYVDSEGKISIPKEDLPKMSRIALWNNKRWEDLKYTWEITDKQMLEIKSIVFNNKTKNYPVFGVN